MFFHNLVPEETSRGKKILAIGFLFTLSVDSHCVLYFHIRDFTHPLSYTFIAHSPLTAAPLPEATAVSTT